jgi:hypothetical protein
MKDRVFSMQWDYFAQCGYDFSLYVNGKKVPLKDGIKIAIIVERDGRISVYSKNVKELHEPGDQSISLARI